MEQLDEFRTQIPRVMLTESSPKISQDERNASLALLIATFFWGASFTWAKVAGERVLQHAGLPPGAALGPMLILGWRFILAGVFWLIIFPDARRGWSMASVWRTLIIGVPLGAGMISQHLGLDRTSEAVAAFLTSLTIIFVPLLMTIALRKPPAATMWIGVVTAGVGIYLMTGPTPTGFGRGEVFGLGAAILFSFYILAVNALMPQDDPVRITVGQFFVAGLISLGACVFVEGGHRIMLSTEMARLVFSRDVVINLALLIVVPTIGAYGLLNYFQPRIDATRAALIYMVEPIFASAFAWYMTGRGLETSGLIGAALILIANLVVELLAARTRVKVVVLD
jgi:drug/metabolite transporter (DMT)-like permease